MDTNKIKKLIIAIASVICIIVVALVIVLLTNKRQVENQENPNKGFVQDEIAKDNVVEEESIEQFDFLIVSNCVSSYLSGINQDSSRYYGRDENNNNVKIVDQEQINKNAYDLLNAEYIEKNSITIDNVYEYVPKVEQDLLFTPIEMKIRKADNVNRYLVYGLASDLNYNPIGYFYTIIDLDKYNKAFSVEPIDKAVYENGEIQNNNIRVEANDNNKYSYQDFTEDTAAKQYFRNYKILALSNPEVAYQFLNEEYRNKAFQNVDNFKEYINNNRDKISEANLKAYGITPDGEYAEYIEKDEKDHYYIFNISYENASRYNVMLDTYVVGSKEFKEEYPNSDDRKKVILNTMRFIYAINDKNYYYAYNILDENFKKNNFSSLQAFENYVKNNFYEYNETSSSFEFRQEGDYYTYDTQIKSGSGSDVESKPLSVIMQLKEGTDFVMSFNVE